MSVASAYSNAVGRATGPSDEAVKAAAVKQIAKHAWEISISEWLRNEITKVILGRIEEDYLNFESKARSLALTYHEHKNNELIVSLLIQAATLRKIKDTYARTSD